MAIEINLPSQDARPLLEAQVGDRVQIVALNCGEANSRLMGMGLMPGVVLQVMSSSAMGSIVVALHDHRLGLGIEMAQQIQVIDAGEQAGTQQDTLATQRMTSMQAPPGNSAIKLRDAAIGSTLRVVGYEPTARDYKRKLLAMGLTPGTEFVVKRHAPLGDPIEIEVRDFRLSLRKAEAAALIVEPVAGEQS
ncbi:MAG: FeoA family protein [Kovacikia sp.]